MAVSSDSYCVFFNIHHRTEDYLILEPMGHASTTSDWILRKPNLKPRPAQPLPAGLHFFAGVLRRLMCFSLLQEKLLFFLVYCLGWTFRMLICTFLSFRLINITCSLLWVCHTWGIHIVGCLDDLLLREQLVQTQPLFIRLC